MTIEEQAKILSDWASHSPIIRRMWICGSTVEGTAKPGSDLEVAVEVHKELDDQVRFVSWMFNIEQIQQELSALFPFPVHVEYYGPNRESCVRQAIEEHGILVYQCPPQ